MLTGLKFVGLAVGEIPTDSWSLLGEGIGTFSDFATPESFALSPGGGVREVRINAGRATAYGVDAILPAPASIFLPEAIGSARAWAICILRDWSGSPTGLGASDVVALDCLSASPVRPSSAKRRIDGSLQDHQLIGYGIVTPGASQVQVINCRRFAEKSALIEHDLAASWDPRPGLLNVRPDGTTWSITSAGQLAPVAPRPKQFLSFDRSDIATEQIGSRGELRVYWPQPLSWTPKISAATVYLGPMSTGAPVLAFPDLANPPSSTQGHLILRTPDGLPYRGFISRLSVSLMEA